MQIMDHRLQCTNTPKKYNAEFSPKEDAIDVETTKQEYLHKQTSQARALEDQTEKERKDCISLSVDSDQKSQTMKQTGEMISFLGSFKF